MRRFRNQVFVVFFPFFALLGFFGCSPSEPPPPQPEVENVAVRRAQPQRTVVDAEDIPLPNCGGSGPLTQSLGSEASVRRGTTIKNAHSVVGGAAVDIPEIAEVYLEGEIEEAYQDEYESANKRLDTVEMVAAQKTHSVYEIIWEQISYESVVAFTLDGEGVEADYSFVMNVPKVADSRSEICPTETPSTKQGETSLGEEALPSNTTNTPTVEPEDLPPVTVTSTPFPTLVEPPTHTPTATVRSTETIVSAPILQVGPYWGWRNELGTETLMLNILTKGSSCIDSVDIFVDGQKLIASLITDPDDPHEQAIELPFEGDTGMSCNYLISNGSLIRPTQSFSVPLAKLGIKVSSVASLGEWCYQDTEKTWYPICN